MMTLPYSVANLYAGGIIDYIPYDIYDNTTSAQNINTPKQSLVSAGPEQDSFYRSDKSLRESILEEANDTKKNSVLKSGSASVWKGLASLALIIATPILIIKGLRRKPVKCSAQKNHFEKLNPKNWFRKK